MQTDLKKYESMNYIYIGKMMTIKITFAFKWSNIKMKVEKELLQRH